MHGVVCVRMDIPVCDVKPIEMNVRRIHVRIQERALMESIILRVSAVPVLRE
jgi:hypothetical protein